MVLTPLASSHSIKAPLTYPSVVAAADWWDPNDEDLSVVAAYRAVNSVGTPWPGGPGVYADTLVNQANPGTYDLIEGNEAVPWAAATGWGFVAAAAQYFDTGVIGNQGWSFLIQYADSALAGITGSFQGGDARFYLRTAGVYYASGGNLQAPPAQATGNLGFAGQQGYRNGVVDGGAIPDWGAVNVWDAYLGALNNTGVAINFETYNLWAAIFYNAVLIPAQMLAVATAMAAL